MKVLLLDNYDSFTYNLAHYVEANDVECTVVFNDKLDMTEVDIFDKVIISPGPGLPKDSGQLMNLIDHCEGRVPILGICLGMQGIAEYYGGKIHRMEKVAHGVSKRCKVVDTAEILFQNIPQDFNAGMYHSWAVEESALPKELVVTAKGVDNVVMGIRHVGKDVRGLQFHPESIMTTHGMKMIENWLLA